jgi:hypothetical protein
LPSYSLRPHIPFCVAAIFSKPGETLKTRKEVQISKHCNKQSKCACVSNDPKDRWEKLDRTYVMQPDDLSINNYILLLLRNRWKLLVAHSLSRLSVLYVMGIIHNPGHTTVSISMVVLSCHCSPVMNEMNRMIKTIHLKHTEPLRGHELNINNDNTNFRIWTRPVVFKYVRSCSNTNFRICWTRPVVFEHEFSYLNTTGRVRTRPVVLKYEGSCLEHDRACSCKLHWWCNDDWYTCSVTWQIGESLCLWALSMLEQCTAPRFCSKSRIFKPQSHYKLTVLLISQCQWCSS